MVIPRNDAMELKNRTALKIAIYEKYLKMSNIASFEETYFARTSKEGIYPQLHYNLNGPQCDRARDSRYQIKSNAAVFKDQLPFLDGSKSLMHTLYRWHIPDA